MALSIPASAQEEKPDLTAMGVGELVNGSMELMKQRNWAEALRWSDFIVKEFGDGAPSRYGPRFGGIYYRKGICEMQVKKWKAAQKSFETCYTDFPNTDPERTSSNQFDKLSLLRWAEAAVGGEDWELGLDMYKKFFKERKRTDSFDRGKYHIQQALCYYNLGNFASGNDNFETAIKNKIKYSVTESAVLAAFEALVKAVIANDREQVLLDFLAKNRGVVITEPFLMHTYAPLFMKLASDAIKADMESSALLLYQLIPTTEEAIADTREKLEGMGPLPRIMMGTVTLNKERLEKRMEALEKQMEGDKNLDIIRLAAIAYLYEKHGNVRGAYAAYKQLELYYANSVKREDYLYNLVRTGFAVDIGTEALTFATLFLKDFPESDKAEEIRRMMLTTLFANGEYEECIERAVDMLPTLKVGTTAHDMCLHVLGGSYFYTAKYEEAQPHLDKHVETYPKSTYAIPTAYFQASNVFRLDQLTKAGPMLDAFVEKYPDPGENVYIPYAMYDRGTIHYQLQEYDKAMDTTMALIDKFPDSNILDQIYILKGNIQLGQEDEKNAEVSYKRGLEIAETTGNAMAASEAIANIISLKVSQSEDDPTKLEEALPFVDKYWSTYAEGGAPYKAQMSMGQVPVLEAADRLQEAIDHLQRAISLRAQDPMARGMDTMLAIYAEAYLKKHSPEELKKHFNTFPGVVMANRAARALLQIAIIQMYEEEARAARKAQDDAKLRDATARVQVEFQNLKRDFAVKDLQSAILVKVGDYLRTKTATPREALSFYDEAILRDEPQHIFGALLGRADIYGQAKNPADLARGLEDFKRVFEQTEDRTQKEFSLYRMTELLLAKGDYEEASKKAELYLAEKTYRKYKPAMKLMLADSYAKRKMTNDAISMYSKVWIPEMGNIGVSAPAIVRYMELLWDRNNASAKEGAPADRQGAYQAGAKYIDLTRPLIEKMSAEDLQLWKEVDVLVRTYETKPGIKTMAEIKREQEDNQ